jgi:ribonuclease HI
MLPAMSADPANVTIYADGAASPNPGAGGYGLVILRNQCRQEASGSFRLTTNNRMELLGAIVGLRSLNGDRCTVTLYSDSKYLVDNFSRGHARKWRQAGWTRNKGKERALNPDLWNELLELCSRHDVKMVWVRGHTDNKENARCDELAVAARLGKDLPADEGYEHPVVPASPELNFLDRLQW